MGEKIKIGIGGNLLIMQDSLLPGMYRTYVNHNYVTSLEKAGAVPVLLPVLRDPEDIRVQLRGLDGVLVPGGYDIDPSFYGEEPQPELGYIMPEVDAYTISLIRMAAELQLPVLGICKGIQAINVAFGGTLYQSQDKEIRGCIKHVQAAARKQPTHSITILPGSFLSEALGTEIRVNSFHHQSIKKLAEGFRVTASAPDGVVECIERADAGQSFMCGVQFHPEMMAEFDNPDMLRLFAAFAAKCRR